MTVNDTKAVAGHVGGNSRFGRTTKLVLKATGEVLFEGLGDHTRRALWKTFTNLDKCKNCVHVGDEDWRK